MVLLLIMLKIPKRDWIGGQVPRPYSGTRHQDYSKEETRSTVLCPELPDTTLGVLGTSDDFLICNQALQPMAA